MSDTESPSAQRPRYPTPPDVYDALKTAGMTEAYEARPPYQRNDYIGWITRAKQDETRQRRITQMLAELDSGDVYMKMAWKSDAVREGKPPSRSTAETIDAYIAEFPPDTQKVLQQVRVIIRAAAPDAIETISYAIPTYDLNGGHLVHFAGYRHHIGFYPTGHGTDAFAEELTAYKSGKGSVQFPLGQPLPADLIRRIVEYRVAECAGERER